MLKKMDGMVDCQGRLKAFIVSNNLNLLILARELCSFIGRKFFVSLEGKVSLSM